MDKLTVITKFKKLFPEESFISGLDKINSKNIQINKSSQFVKRLNEHLLFYEENLYPLPFEKLYKCANLVFYHLLIKTKIDLNRYKIFKKINQEISKNRSQSLVENLAIKHLKRILTRYLLFDKNNRLKLLSKKLKIKNLKDFNPPMKDFYEWQKNLYGLELIDKKILINEAFEIYKKIKNRKFKNIKWKGDNTKLINFYLNYFQEILKVELPEIIIKNTPGYLKIAIPTAAAYTIDRFTNVSRYIVFVNLKSEISISKLFFVLFHEVFGHILHFYLAKKLCRNKIKLISYMNRFPLTEGFALLAEDYFLKAISKEKFQEIFRKNLKIPNQVFYDGYYVFYKYRLLRYLRYIFEIEVYLEKKNPLESVKTLSQMFGFETNALKEDLYAYLLTPGYASCYIGGYKILKDLGRYNDENFRKHIASSGFVFIDQLE